MFPSENLLDSCPLCNLNGVTLIWKEQGNCPLTDAPACVPSIEFNTVARVILLKLKYANISLPWLNPEMIPH